MKFADQRFEHWIDRGNHVYQGIECERCEFFCCDISLCDTPAQRSIVRNAELRQCIHSGNRSSGHAIYEEILVTDLKTPGDLVIHGAVYKHVTLKGQFGRIIVNYAPSYPLTKRQIDAFSIANDEYYKTVDWALDISQGRFHDASIRLPARLIRRDPNTQIVVPRDNLLDGRWKELDFSTSPGIGMALQFNAEGSMIHDVLIADTVAMAQCRKDLAVFDILRREGIALPD